MSERDFAEGGGLYRRLAWRILPILIVVQIVSFLDRANVSFAQLQMKADLGFGDAAYGLGAGIFFLGYFVFEVPSNLLLRKVGARVWFTRILVTWGAATAAMAFVTDVKAFYVLRFLVGAAEAGFAPGTQLYFSRWFPDSQRGRINGLFLMTIPISFMIGGPISGTILAHFDDIAGFDGWRWLFILEGATTILLAPLLYFGLPESPARSTWLSHAERGRIHEDLARMGSGPTDHRFLAILADRGVITLSAVYFLLLCGQYGVTFWMPLLISDTGIRDPQVIGWLSVLPYLAAAIAMPLVCRWSDSRGRRFECLVVCACGATVGLLLAAVFHASLFLALTGLAMTAACVMSSVPIYWAVVARQHPGVTAAAAFAIINSFGNLAGFVSPYAVGLITAATGVPAMGLYLIAGLVALGACGLVASHISNRASWSALPGR